MRVLVASAAIIVAAVVPIVSSDGEQLSCSDCLQSTPAVPAAVHPIADVAAGISASEIAEQLQVAAGVTPPAQTVEPEQGEAQSANGPVEAQAPDLCDTLIDAAEANGLPAAFLARLIWQESRFDPKSLSPAGAQGIAQFMPRTAVEIGLSNPWDPIEAVPASARLLNKLRAEFGNLGLAAGAYNAGRGRIRDWLSNRQSLPKETRNYIRIITGQTPETWIDQSKALALATKLPRGMPCTDIASADDPGELPVAASLTPQITNLIEKARIERIAAESRRRKSTRSARARHGKTLVASAHRTHQRVAAKASKKIRLASAK